jgi:3-oxoacyl-[acyl-carrier protein] reductase
MTIINETRSWPSLRGSVVLVTGASGSIGFEIAAEAAAAGAIVGVHGSRPETVANAMTLLKSRVSEAQLIAAEGDFRRLGVIEEVVSKVAKEGRRLDALIHCAIAGAPDTTGELLKTDSANYGQLAENVLGIFQRLCFSALPHLAKQGGTIIGFASDAGRYAAPRQALVGAVFGGVMSFVRNLAMEAARDGVRVHCISPTYVEGTAIFDRLQKGGRAETARKRAGLGLPSPKDIAPLALFLCGAGATKITGQIISINGGLNA